MLSLLMMVPVFSTMVCSFVFLRRKDKKGDGCWAAIIIPWVFSIISITIVVAMSLPSNSSK